MDGAAGEADGAALRVAFDHRLTLEFHGSKVTSDAGLLPVRDLEDALGLTDLAGEVLADTRTGQNSRHTLIAQLRQSVFGRLAGYEDVNDADRLAHDPAMRWVVGSTAVTRQAASTSQMGRFETEVMTEAKNLAALTDLSGHWIDRVHARRPVKGIVLDMDSSVSPTFGEPEGSAYNGHFGCPCYHPLFVFNQFGDLERCALRPGNVHSAEGWHDVLEPVVARYRTTLKRRYFRADAAFASPEVYEFLEAEGYGYVIRLPANAVLQRRIAHLLKRPVGRPPHEVRRFYASFRYQAQSWSHSRRVVAKVAWYPGELYPRVGFLVTNLCRPAERVVAFYNQRGPSPASCSGVQPGQLLPHSGSATRGRTLVSDHASPDEVERWSLTTLRAKVVKIGAKVIAHDRYTVFQMAEVAVPRNLFRRILAMIDDLRPRQVARC